MTLPPDSPAALCAALNRRLEQLAADDAWQELAAVVVERDALLASIPAAERKAALLAARRCTERLRALAQSAKAQCTQELTALQHGRRAAASYRACR
jgi:hypothetical protein